MYDEFIERKVAQISDLRSQAVRGVEESYLTGNSELFDRTSQAFDVSSGLVERLTDLRRKDELDAEALGELVKSAALANILMEEAVIIKAIPHTEQEESTGLDQETAGFVG